MKERGINRFTGRSWQNLLAALVLLVSISASGGLAAQTEKGAGAQGGTKNACVGEDKKIGADEKVVRMIEEWKRKDPTGQAFHKRHSMGEIILVDWAEIAELPTTEKRWGQARSIAYVDAFTGATEHYVSQKREEIKYKLIREYLFDDDDSVSNYQQGGSANDLLSRMMDKATVLEERNLDKALEESGMSADEIERMTAPQKTIKFKKRLNIEALATAAHSAAGLVPIKTFEAIDCENNSAIGVVAAVSHSMANLAAQIVQKRAIRPDGGRKGKPIANRIMEFSEMELTNEFGPRVWWDEHGYPTIVAFGQWAWTSKGLSLRRKAKHREFAMQQALMDAKSKLTKFINASTRFETISKKGIQAERSDLVYKDNTMEEVETRNLVSKTIKTARVRSDVKITGLKIQRRWFSGHFLVQDHELVGTIVSWSPAQEDQIRKVERKKPRHLAPAEKKVQKPRASSGSSKSLDLMKAKDF